MATRDSYRKAKRGGETQEHTTFKVTVRFRLDELVRIRQAAKLLKQNQADFIRTEALAAAKAVLDEMLDEA